MAKTSITIAGFAAIVALSGCIETVGTVDGTRDFGSGRDNNGNVVSGNIVMRTDNSYLLTLNRRGANCTAVFDEPAGPRRTELSDLLCTDGNNGNVTLVYGDNAMPRRAVFSSNSSGTVIGGTISF